MDRVRAARMAEELLGSKVGSWTPVRLIDSGKSAVVFEAESDSTRCALKIFDPELVERFGTDVQSARVERELALRGKEHPHLVRILDGGQCPKTKYFFIAMELLAGQPLSKVLQMLPREKIWPIMAQVASAARFLEQLNLVHRDIKPDNIVVDDDFHIARLLDLGIIRPIGEPGITDGDDRTFIGTLQYSSPEFLFRTENDTPDGWRALTFYQLGALLHDLIMPKNFCRPVLSLRSPSRGGQKPRSAGRGRGCSSRPDFAREILPVQGARVATETGALGSIRPTFATISISDSRGRADPKEAGARPRRGRCGPARRDAGASCA